MPKLPAFLSGAFVVQDAGTAYASARLGQRFAIAHATPGTTITSPSTAFDATKPTFLFEQGAISTTRCILSRIYVVQAGTVAGGGISIAVLTDSVARRTAGGTQVVPYPTNSASSNNANVAFWTLPTASAAPGTQRVVAASSAAELVGTVTEIDFKDGIMIGAPGSILVYAWAAVTAPTWTFFFEIMEETI